MKVLIACEYSGIVREAFKAKGHDAWSCDLEDTEIPGQHIKGDVLTILDQGWDLMIGHPPCTHLAVSGARWFENKQIEQRKAIYFFLALYNAPIEKICIENPVGIMSSVFKKPDQIIQPYYFGNEATKTTCLWLKNLPKLIHIKEDDLFYKKTHVYKGDRHITKSGRSLPAWYNLPPQKNRSKIRSKTFPSIAKAMADQWNFN